ncbi:hypothetical protein LR48_Vigan11g064900 [Vigna angularis]|uniref:Uncharacterized protein n=1 Tax=Phaseolus angularis TaxID=3914 RepID=A0A0L9VRB5_PHAAN|nr:hypothetical protein LR48_Vigan11g064900 [Vigna angularis]
MDVAVTSLISRQLMSRSTTNQEGLLEELADRSRARKDDRPSEKCYRNILAPTMGPSGIPVKPRRTRRALGLDIAVWINTRDVQPYIQPSQEVRKMTPASRPLGGKSEKWLQKSPLNAGSQKNDSYLKTARQKNSFRYPRSTQDVGKMTPASAEIISSIGPNGNSRSNLRRLQPPATTLAATDAPSTTAFAASSCMMNQYFLHST